MAGFDNIELARAAGMKSKRGPAKISGTTKQKIAEMVERLYSDVMDGLDSLEIKEKAQLLTKLIEYEVPKQRSVEYTTDFDKLSDAQLDYILDNLKNDTGKKD